MINNSKLEVLDNVAITQEEREDAKRYFDEQTDPELIAKKENEKKK